MKRDVTFIGVIVIAVFAVTFLSLSSLSTGAANRPVESHLAECILNYDDLTNEYQQCEALGTEMYQQSMVMYQEYVQNIADYNELLEMYQEHMRMVHGLQ